MAMQFAHRTWPPHVNRARSGLTEHDYESLGVARAGGRPGPGRVNKARRMMPGDLACFWNATSGELLPPWVRGRLLALAHDSRRSRSPREGDLAPDFHSDRATPAPASRRKLKPNPFPPVSVHRPVGRHARPPLCTFPLRAGSQRLARQRSLRLNPYARRQPRRDRLALSRPRSES